MDFGWGGRDLWPQRTERCVGGLLFLFCIQHYSLSTLLLPKTNLFTLSHTNQYLVGPASVVRRMDTVSPSDGTTL